MAQIILPNDQEIIAQLTKWLYFCLSMFFQICRLGNQMKKEGEVITKVLVFMFMAGVYLLILILSPGLSTTLGREDGIIESLTALFFGIAALQMGYLFFSTKSRERKYIFHFKRNIFYLLLGIIFFVFMGEEISWGQRIFGWHTPDWIKTINNQEEINFHNIRAIEASVDKQGLARWLTAGRVFTLFWLLYCLLIPLMDRYLLFTHNLFRKIYLPLLPIWLGLGFLLNFLLFNVLEEVASSKLDPRDPEYVEMIYAFLFLVASVIILKKSTKVS